MSKPDMRSSQPKQVNRHAVTDPRLCQKMSRKYGWTLLDIEPTGVKELPYDCIFEGEQTSFEDKTYD